MPTDQEYGLFKDNPLSTSIIDMARREVLRETKKLEAEIVDLKLNLKLLGIYIQRKTAAKSKKKIESILPEKIRDLSGVFADAKLTPKQWEVCSMISERKISVNQTAIRLGISRKTVDEHLALARAKLERNAAFQKKKKKISETNPEGNG